MSKKIIGSPSTDLRADADAAVAHWSERDAVLATKRTAREQLAQISPLPLGSYSGDRIITASPLAVTHLQSQIAEAQAAASAAIAEREACLALDALELATDGDDAARTRHLPTLRADMVEAIAAVDRAQAALNAAHRAADVRLAAVHAAEATVAARRRAAGLPYAAAQIARVNKPIIARIDDAIAAGLPVGSHAKVVARLLENLKIIAAQLEERRLEDEAIAKELAREKASKERATQLAQERVHAREKAARDERAAEAARRDALANDFLARASS